MLSVPDFNGRDSSVVAVSPALSGHSFLTQTNSARRFAWLIAFCVGLWFSFGASAQSHVTEPCVPSGNALIEAAGTPRVYLLRDGTKYYIPAVDWIAKNGYGGQPLHILQPSAVAAIPSGYDLTDQSPIPGTPATLEGQLLKAHNKVYFVVHGVRHWVLNVGWLAQNGYTFQAPLLVSDAELQALPLGADVDYTPPQHTFEILLLTFGFFALLFITAGRN